MWKKKCKNEVERVFVMPIWNCTVADSKIGDNSKPNND